jgi:FMN phosphatase YigB (HAD superfamily)
MRVIVKTLLFDFDHTLGVDNKLEEEALREIAAADCPIDPSDDAVSAVLRRFRYEPGVPLETAVADGLTSWGCPQDKIAGAVAMFRSRALELAPERVRPMPGAPEMIAMLVARGYGLGILSNGWTQLQHLKAQLIGFPGPVLASEEIDAWKPEKKAFEIALSRFSMDAPTTMYVGDNPAVDIAGAKAAGLLAAWADLDGAAYPAGITRPDLTVTDLAQLPELLG